MPNNIWTASKITTLCRLLDKGVSYVEIAKQFGVTKYAISSLVYTLRSVGSDIPVSAHYNGIRSRRTKRKIEEHQTGYRFFVRKGNITHIIQLTNINDIPRLFDQASDTVYYPCDRHCFYGNARDICSKPKGMEPCCAINRKDHKNVCFVDVTFISNKKQTDPKKCQTTKN